MGFCDRKGKFMLKGDKFNRLTAIKFDHKDKGYNQFWIFRCDCGNEKIIKVSHFKSGDTKSCGCLQRESAKVAALKVQSLAAKAAAIVNRKHGMYREGVYFSWDAMKQRCLNPNNSRYKDYGGRGITICEEWLKFENFYKDIGDKPKGLTLDRIDNNGNYCKENCKWSNSKEQHNNTRKNHLLTYKNKTQTIAQWARELEMNYGTLFARLKRGWDIERAFNKK